MSGHSKWHNIQAKKSVSDSKKGKLYSKHAKLIEVAARHGGDDPTTNVTLRGAIEKAKLDNVPNANIERAVKKGSGDLKDGIEITEGMYEGFAPGGVALYIQVLTDNKNRSLQSIKLLLSKHGGSLGASGSIGWMFERVGVLKVSGAGKSPDDIELAAIDAGARDVEHDDDADADAGGGAGGGSATVTVYTEPQQLHEVKTKLASAGFTVTSSELTYRAKNTAPVSDLDTARRILSLIDLLEEDDDVTAVYNNAQIDDAIVEQL